MTIRYKSGIYYIKNIISNKIYIGSAVNIKQRWRQHRFDLKNDKHSNLRFQNSWNKHGEKAFKFEVIEKVKDKSKLIEKEQFYLDKFQSYNPKNGYNICPTANSSFGLKRGPHTKEHNEKISNSLLGIKRSKNFGEKISKSKQNHIVLDSTRIKISRSLKNLSDDIKRKNKILRSKGQKKYFQKNFKLSRIGYIKPFCKNGHVRTPETITVSRNCKVCIQEKKRDQI